MKGLRPLKHPQSAFGLRAAGFFVPRPDVRGAYIPDYQSNTRSPLVQMYQGNMHKYLCVKRLGATGQVALRFSLHDFCKCCERNGLSLSAL